MKKILPLSPSIIAKIAAGEVIERPAFAVKELVENALDAKAKNIAIHIEEAGLKHIMVVDDGIGMSKKDLLESFKLHTTSKLISIDELAHISSLGFRGEALASIAAISTMLIRSRPKQSVGGTQIQIREGKLVDVSPVGMPQGTTVSVSQLFHSVPARKKFLKTPQTEFRHILQIVTQIVLANPEVAFTLTHNKKMIFDLPKTKKVIERIQKLLGDGFAENLVPLSYQDQYISVSGFIGKPQETARGSGKQFLFINGRTITDNMLPAVVKEAYGTLIMPKLQPVFLIFLTLPFELVDVNVHPRKEHIRFADTNLLTETVRKAVMKTLAETNVTFYDQQSFGIALGDTDLTRSYTGRVLKEQQIPWDIRVRNEVIPGNDITQLHNVYLVTPSRFGMLLVDQHGAHERILYEQFLQEFLKTKKEMALHHFTKPVIIDLSLSDTELLNEYLALFEKLGFHIEHFKGTAFLLQRIPLIFQDRKPKELLLEMLDDLAKNHKTKDVDAVSHKIIAYLACRSAIKAGESLTKKQMKDLLEKLEKTENNATCPHGRPTKIIIDITQLHKMFKRR